MSPMRHSLCYLPAMGHLSYSQVDTLLACGEKYRLTRIEGIEEQPAWFFIGGSGVHAATETIDLILEARNG